jgi:phosphocarrier protein FPr
MVGLVVVSHSRALAEAALELAEEMLHGSRPPIALAAGLDATTLGTDAVQVKDAIEKVAGDDGVVVLLDLGSAVLSAELALDLLDPQLRERVVLSAAPLVEGLVAAAVTAAGGASAAEVAAEAAGALAGKQAQLGVVPAAPVSAASVDAGAARAVFTVENAHGLHARPAARLVAQLRTLDAQVQLTNLTTGAGPVPASSLSRVATLAAQHGHDIEIAATGSQASEAVEQLTALAARHFDEHDADLVAATPQAPGDDVAGPVAASPGVAIGPATRAVPAPAVIPDDEPGDAATQWRRLREAIAATRREIARTRARVSREVGDADAAVFHAHLMLLDDPELLGNAHELIDAGSGAARAWHTASRQVEQTFADLDDPYLRARAADVRAVGDQVLATLLGIDGGLGALAGVVVADDLTPAQVADLDPGLVRGIVLASGSPTSHASIIARSKGIPMVVGVGAAAQRIPDGALLVVDADAGQVHVAPDAAGLVHYRERIADRERAAAAAQAMAAQPAVTADGVEIAVLANVGSVDDAKAAAHAHADGVGLVRTEFLFQSRTEPPSAEEQEEAYRAICEPFAGRRVVFRTLDAGGDKPMPFLPTAREANPFLGVRGLRLSLREQAMLRTQLSALCAVAGDVPLSIMFPMVSTVAEVVRAQALVDEACAGRRPDGLRVGIMVEVPAVALKAAAFAPHAEFFSVGTNDLSQYALAAERGNPALAALADPLDPGVLRLVAELCRGAGDAPVSVCGEVAADPVAVPLLLGLGVRSLSVAPPAIADVKQAVRAVDLGSDVARAAAALRCADAAEVRALAPR